MTVNFVCVWVGDKYGPEYPAVLVDMIKRNASNLEGARFWCLTDHRQADLPEGVRRIRAVLPGWWAKVELFSPDMPWAEGDRIVYLDLDVAITGRLEDLVERKGIIRDWHWPCLNSSVMIWDHGDHRDAWDSFTPGRMERAAGPQIAPLLPAGQINGGDQEHLTEVGGWDILPASWCVSYRSARDWPPDGAKVVVFHGDPKPDACEGWVRDVWKVGGLTSLPVMDGANVETDHILANVAANVQRDVPWFTGFGGQERPLVLCCGGPSMLADIPIIRAQRRRGCRIISVNNAWRALAAAGCVPDVNIMLDARPENAAFAEGAPEGMRWLLASQCHPDLFEALEGRDVVLWHNNFGTGEALRALLAKWWDPGPDQRPCLLIPGGGTVGLRALWLAYFSGYKVVHVYGLDSSYSGDAHHAYAQPLNDSDPVQTVTMGGKAYRCARWMVRQAEEFKGHWRDLKAEGVTLHIHGSGLIPDIARNLRQNWKPAS